MTSPYPPQQPYGQHPAPPQPHAYAKNPDDPQQYGPPQPYPQSPYGGPPQPMSPADEKLWATLIHLGGIFFSFFPALIGYLVVKDRGPFVRAHAATALNFQLTLLLAYIAGAILSVVIVGIFILLAAAVLAIVFPIIGAVKANQGQWWEYPLTIRFVT